jgi:hypothetical protein
LLLLAGRAGKDKLMPPLSVEQRLRMFLLWLSAWLCVGTIVELFLAKHYDDPIQLIPFALCGLGLIAVAAALRWPQRAQLLALRGVMSLLLLGSLLGVYQHLINNFAFELDMRPSAVWSDVWFQALRGAAPLLAPGILAVAAVVAIAATYAHPALAGRNADAMQVRPAAGEPVGESRRS